MVVGKKHNKRLNFLKTELSYDPAIPLLGVHPREMKTGSQRDICTPVFIAALSTVAVKARKQPTCPSRGMDG